MNGNDDEWVAPSPQELEETLQAIADYYNDVDPNKHDIRKPINTGSKILRKDRKYLLSCLKGERERLVKRGRLGTGGDGGRHPLRWPTDGPGHLPSS